MAGPVSSSDSLPSFNPLPSSGLPSEPPSALTPTGHEGALPFLDLLGSLYLSDADLQGPVPSEREINHLCEGRLPSSSTSSFIFFLASIMITNPNCES